MFFLMEPSKNSDPQPSQENGLSSECGHVAGPISMSTPQMNLCE